MISCAMLNKLLIANRGEIATRIIKTASDLGIHTVAIYADDDKDSLHVLLAGEAYPLGPGTLKETYLNISKIIEIAVSANCDSVHPGYGFLSENFLFARECIAHNLIYVGPDPQTIVRLGNKTEARYTVQKLNLPVLKGFECSLKDLLAKHKFKFPLILKPTLGGGGKGMHIVYNHDQLRESFKTASREAGNYFADTRVYFEQYIERARHIEVQIAADHHGNIVHLFERECTIQRNFQKIIEEAPSPSLNEKLREEITSAAVRIAQSAHYTNIGTVEFLLDNQNNWYFIEMNTRIQVEHPVTEAITGIDLVKLQLAIASGQRLPFAQEQVRKNGHAIELRINAEDPEHDFRPSSGYISLLKYPEQCRFDTFVNSPGRLPSQYDSLLGKLIVWGPNREQAHASAVNSLRQTHIHGLQHNINFLNAILNSDNFIQNNLYTRFCHDFIPVFTEKIQKQRLVQPILIPIIAFVYLNFQKRPKNPASIWDYIGYWRPEQEVRVVLDEKLYTVRFEEKNMHYTYDVSGTIYQAIINSTLSDMLTLSINGSTFQITYSLTENKLTIIETGGFQYYLKSPDLLGTASLPVKSADIPEVTDNGYVVAPLYGRITKINVLENAKVNRGDVLLVIESMKTENNITAPKKGTVKSIHVTEGTQVKDNMLLIEIE